MDPAVRKVQEDAYRSAKYKNVSYDQLPAEFKDWFEEFKRQKERQEYENICDWAEAEWRSRRKAQLDFASGEYKGKPLKDLPTPYLNLLCSRYEHDLRICQAELRRRRPMRRASIR
jgi:uncharacterized protein (DUF3820 family)